MEFHKILLIYWYKGNKFLRISINLYVLIQNTYVMTHFDRKFLI